MNRADVRKTQEVTKPHDLLMVVQILVENARQDERNAVLKEVQKRIDFWQEYSTYGAEARVSELELIHAIITGARS